MGYGSNEFNVQSPTVVARQLQRIPRRRAAAVHLGVALQVAFERQTLKPVFSLDRL
jgi:hypothetical protein